MPIYYNKEIIARCGNYLIRQLVMTFPRSEKNTELFSVFIVVDGGERHMKDFNFEHSARNCIEMESRRPKHW